MSAEAEQAAVEGVAGAITSASAINFAARTANLSNGVAINDCMNAGLLLQGGVMPTGYSMGAFPYPISAGEATQCTVYKTNGPTADATITGID